MPVTSIVPALLVIAAALATIAFCGRLVAPPERRDRYASIDGLRGYLALFVFLHHACVWYFYLQVGRWEVPPSSLYTHFGQSSVALFFMITGFLFFTKIIGAAEKPIDWPRLLTSRVLRLLPLYVLFLLLLVLLVTIVSAGKLQVSATQALVDLLRWGSFTILGAPDLNQVADTWRITAGVTWSLPYEWLFYATLPLQALLTRSPVALRHVLLSAVIAGAILLVWSPLTIHLLTFVGGMVAAVTARSARFRTFAVSLPATILIALALLLLVSAFPNAGSYPQIILLSVAFSMIAAGNSACGILTHRLSRWLGEISYGVYLLHGMLLFVLFNFVLGTEPSARLSPLAYWAGVVALTPVLVSLCALAFAFVERPGIESTDRILGWIRRRPPA